MRGGRALALLLGLTLVALPGCGKSTKQPVATIAVIAPISHGVTAFGRGIRDSVDLAIREANRRHAVKGWTLRLAVGDDQSTPDIGAAAARRLAADPTVAGVIGTYNSGVASAVVPELDRAALVMISPGNTDPGLSRSGDSRPHADYYRVVTTDAVQGPFGAEYAYRHAGARTVAVVYENKPVSEKLALAFKDRFTADGGKIVDVEAVPAGTTEFSAIVPKIAPLRPDLVFFGGEYPLAGPLAAELHKAGLAAPLMGGDGIFDPKFIELAGPGSDGDLATAVGAPATALPSARRYINDYKVARYREAFSNFGPYAFDAANVLIDALARVLPGRNTIDTAARRAIERAVQQTDKEGITGHIAFDRYGDTVTRELTVYRVSNGVWKQAEIAEFR